MMLQMTETEKPPNPGAFFYGEQRGMKLLAVVFAITVGIDPVIG